MVKSMEKEKNIMITEKLNLKENILMEKNGMVKDIKNQVFQNLNKKTVMEK